MTSVRNQTKRLLIFQSSVGLMVAIGFFAWKGSWEAISVLFGVLTSLVSALMLGSGVTKASAQALENPKFSMGILYFGAVKRFLLVLVLFVLGLWALKLDALAMCAGFMLAQLGFLFTMRGFTKPAG